MDPRSSFAIGEILGINYLVRTVRVVSPPGGLSSLPDVKVIDSINLGTKDEPIVTLGEKVLIWRPSTQNSFLAIEIDPQIEKPITNLSDLIKCAHTLTKIHETSYIWWRGHDKADHKLVPDVYRHGRSREYERTIFARFKDLARSRHNNCPPDDNLEEWHFLMRHYGLRTSTGRHKSFGSSDR